MDPQSMCGYYAIADADLRGGGKRKLSALEIICLRGIYGENNDLCKPERTKNLLTLSILGTNDGLNYRFQCNKKIIV